MTPRTSTGSLRHKLWYTIRRRGMSERELAEGIGMQPRTVRRWFEGKSRIRDPGTLRKLWKALPEFDPFSVSARQAPF